MSYFETILSAMFEADNSICAIHMHKIEKNLIAFIYRNNDFYHINETVIVESEN